MKEITIATRGSKLALWQAEYIKSRLINRYPGLSVDLLVVKTTGDKIQDVPLAKVGGKGLFVKEIEEAILDGRADLAVHSMKDVPAELPEGLKIGIIPERESRYDLLLSEKYADLASMPHGSVIGTSSLRRQSQIMYLRPDLKIKMLRGNLDTRLRKLREGMYDAIIAAEAGMRRMEFSTTYESELLPPYFLPAVGQGALGVEYSSQKPELDELLGFMDHAPTRFCVVCERAFLAELEGGCQVPIACLCLKENNRLYATGLVSDVHGKTVIRRTMTGKPKDAHIIGVDLARKVLEGGGREILDQVYSSSSEDT